ncbi:hypothetical protein D7V80_06270 [Corallococcus sp. CA054B]|uniref:hypothetical protein n=1 Tax=Corallococcus sp. CA054B TaxID=2316734 RepID=UPI000EEADCE4|nr:hypothetical protein [Corallococcus sp. CA054B]RKG70188.1 hypothetical protein D7V80_06270 [Corallococcus sp. CA054B]
MSRLVSRALVGMTLLLAGCDSSADTDGYKQVDCSYWWSRQPLFDDLRPSAGLDAVQVRGTREQPLSEGPASGSIASWGQACATATDIPACQAAVEAARPSEGFHSTCYADTCAYHFLLTTQGDQVRTHSTPASVREVLGTIDTEQEAVLMVYAMGYDFLCYDVDQGGVKANADGSFDVIGFRGIQCDGDIPITQHVFHVPASGEVRELESHVLQGGEETCGAPP